MMIVLNFSVESKIFLCMKAFKHCSLVLSLLIYSSLIPLLSNYLLSYHGQWGFLVKKNATRQTVEIDRRINGLIEKRNQHAMDERWIEIGSVPGRTFSQPISVLNTMV